MMPSRPNSSWFLARLDGDLIKHVLAAQRFGDSFRLMLSQWTLRIVAGDFEYALVDHIDTQRTECHPGGHLNVIHVMNLEVAVLFDPVFDERIAQSVFGLAFGQVSAFHD